MAETNAANKSHNDMIMRLIDKKQQQELENKSVEELQAMIK